jgi:hypothetical protein
MKALSKNPMILAGTNSVDNATAQKSGNVANGSALATLYVTCVKGQSVTLTRYLRDLTLLSAEGVAEFRKSLGEHRTAMNAHVKAAIDRNDPEAEIFKGAAASAKTRISEAMKFAEAVGKGFSPDFTRMDYHALVTAARRYVEGVAGSGGENAVSPGLKRGPKAKSFMEKLQAFLEKTRPTDAEIQAAAKALAGMKASEPAPF